ncbi:cobalamin/Fe(3+)-siderophore ABC transporter ATP-binding protein [Arthrobacter psychrolactophilus]|uniref:Cobalamin/Fe(3+)-siderophore ABC transporter ATP-binding protein n=1 Tax=Arthrobacter psychrolactophilus TaxID=92442 RepID=A0A2V5J891_9MICC|nr:ABC transporter ATP-binding protein [Arthrobacter psychrolactophilus]PYI39190.1 cobalamin/Fe(3+)-siderophore ABC transporter ATP-binding protein [Arthrobacter psychrolactophilus]
MSATAANSAATLSAHTLTLGYGDRAIVDELTVELPAGKVTIIVGANACGKSTLLRGLARLLKPSSGVVHLNGTDIHRMPTRELARELGILPQTPVAPDGITVADLVGRGRSPHQGWFRQWTPADDDAVAAALNVTGTAELAGRSIDELSGGQRQRVWIAMALAQETDVLLLDEPTTYLDLAHQVEVLDVVSELNARRGITVAIVLHDLNLAARYADHLIAMRSGSIVAQGAPGEVLTAELVQTVFGLESVVVPDPVVGTPMVVPIGRRAAQLADAAATKFSDDAAVLSPAVEGVQA